MFSSATKWRTLGAQGSKFPKAKSGELAGHDEGKGETEQLEE